MMPMKAPQAPTGFKLLTVNDVPLYVPVGTLTAADLQAVPEKKPDTLRVPHPDEVLMRIAVVHVRGRRIGWSMSPNWSPLNPAMGAGFEDAKRKDQAGTCRGKAHRVVRDLLNRGVKGVLVHGAHADRVVYASRPDKGGSIRAAWSETVDWNPVQTGRSVPYQRAHARGLAGIVYGAEGLERVLSPVR